MSFWFQHRYPVRDDYDTEEEYEEAVRVYEYWEYFAVEEN